ESVLFSGTTPLAGFDGSNAGWEHHQQQQPVEIGRFQRLFAWNSSGGDAGGGNGGGFIFGTPSQQSLPLTFGQNSQFFSQRGPLQSSNTPLVRAWIDHPIDEHHHHHQIPQNIHQQAALSSMGFTTSGVYSGFRVPSRIQGQEEEHDSIANKLEVDNEMLMMDSRSVLREDFGHIESMAYTLGKKESVSGYSIPGLLSFYQLIVCCFNLYLIELLELNYGFLGHIMCFVFSMFVLFATICQCYI
ncbi:hypothetical protein Goari_010402, partial [Gossypium aridum]|nr:hypothetical protein [Gossypium aridum]